MTVDAAQIEREKQELPMGWGRFGKALDQLVPLSEPDETLLATCVTLNPDYHHQAGFAPGSVANLAFLAQEARQSTNVVVACTDRRLLLVLTGVSGAPRGDVTIPFAGTHIAERDKKAFVLEHAGARIRFRGGAKKPVARFLDALTPRVTASG